jgi:hypothetical protein
MLTWRAVLLLALAALVPIATAVAPAAAHTNGMAPVLPATPAVAETGPSLTSTAAIVAAQPPAPVWVVILALAVTLALGRRRPRRVLALGLVLVLTLFAFASAIHSVHHLGSPDRPTDCPVASAATQTAGTVVAPVAVLPVAVLVTLAGALLDDRTPLSRSLGADRDRAPPVLA